MADDADQRRIKADIAAKEGLLSTYEQRVRTASSDRERTAAVSNLRGLQNEIVGLKKFLKF